MITEPIPDATTDPGEASSPQVPLRLRLAEALVAAGIAVLGVVILVESRNIPIPRALTAVGPRNIPVLVGSALVLIGTWYALEVLIGRAAAPSGDSEDADPTLPADWGVLAQLGIVMAVYAILMEPAGFVLASAVLFSGTAFAMGSRRYPRDIALGIGLAVVTWLLFDRWLGIRLPAGVLEGLG